MSRISRKLAALRYALLLPAIAVLAGCGGSSPSGAATSAPPPAPAPAPADSDNYVPEPGCLPVSTFWQTYGPSRVICGDSSHVSRLKTFHIDLTGNPAQFGVSGQKAVGYPYRGQQFHLSMWLRSARPVRVTVQFNESGGSKPPQAIASTTRQMAPRWRRIELAGKVRSSGRTSIDVFVYASFAIARGASFDIDDVRLVSGK